MTEPTQLALSFWTYKVGKIITCCYHYFSLQGWFPCVLPKGSSWANWWLALADLLFGLISLRISSLLYFNKSDLVPTGTVSTLELIYPYLIIHDYFSNILMIVKADWGFILYVASIISITLCLPMIYEMESNWNISVTYDYSPKDSFSKACWFRTMI